MVKTDAPVLTLDQLLVDAEFTEQNAAKVIAGRLREAEPRSLSEARITEKEYHWLRKWAAEAVRNAFANFGMRKKHEAGLVLLTLLAEFNRRESEGDTVYVGVPELFHDDDARKALFNNRGIPTQRLRELLKSAVEHYRLRNAFDAAEPTLPYYMTIQLQYGFCRAQIEREEGFTFHVRAAMRLADPNDSQRSRSFQLLMAQLKSYRRGWSHESDARSHLKESHWILREWIETLLRQAEKSTDLDAEEEEVEPPLVERLRLGWCPENGPYWKFRPAPPTGWDTAGIVTLQLGSRTVARWLEQPEGGVYRGDDGEVEAPAGKPTLDFHLEHATRGTLSMQSMACWNANDEVTVLRLKAAPPENESRWETGHDLVVIVRPEHRWSVEPDTWFLTGHGVYKRRWLRFLAAPSNLRISDESGRLVRDMVAVPPPAWAKLRTPLTDCGPYELGSESRLVLLTEPDIHVDWLVANSQAMSLNARTKTGKLTLDVETALHGIHVRAGVIRGGDSAVVQHVVPCAVRGLAEQKPGEGWVRHDPRTWLHANHGRSNQYRVLTANGATPWLMEGSVNHGECNDRPRRLSNLQWTGAPLTLCDKPWNGQQEHRLAAATHDSGIVLRVSKEWAGTLDLKLLQPLEPRAAHSVLLWSKEHGLHITRVIRVGEDRRTWTIDCPWPTAPKALIAAIVYDGAWLGTGWWGHRERFFAEDDDHLTPRQRFALIRWLRLPALWEVKPGIPAVQALVHRHVADLLAVQLFDDGLDAPGLESAALRFEPLIDDSAFPNICRRSLIDANFTGPAEAETVVDLFDSMLKKHRQTDSRGFMVEKLFPTHPLLASQVVQFTWHHPKVSSKALSDQIRDRRYELAKLPKSVTGTQFNSVLQGFLERSAKTLSTGIRDFDDVRTWQDTVIPARKVITEGTPLGMTQRHCLLAALRSSHFRDYLALELLRTLEDRPHR